MQQLWQIGLQWDDPLPCDIVDTWRMFSDELPLVEKIKIPRYIPTSNISSAQLLGFSDASEKGYATVIYLRIVHNDNLITVHFLTSKSKVAPLKIGKCDDKISIPRLELCGALLLAQTMERVRPIFGQIPNLTEHAWTDSTVVLSWLTSSQATFKIFVSNRLAKIANILPSCHWHYVSSGQNPADCVSRDLALSQAVSMSLYWNGPSFLRSSEDTWPIDNYVKLSSSSLPELKNINVDVSVLTTLSTHTYDWISRFSSLVRLQKTISYVRRFIGLRLKRLPMRTGTITSTELDESLTCAIRSTQTIYFKGLVKLMQSNNKPIVPRSIAQLVPFVDTEGVIRIGGRLRNAEINVHQQYPVLLPKKCALTNILIRHFHITYLHAGQQLVSSLISQKYWILSSRSAIRHIIFKCVVCARHRATAPQPIMADLPSFRVRPCRPFSNVGVDFAGPFQVKESRRKNAKAIKGYLAVFVCTVIKSVHLEIVSDLSTDAFMASFNRFISRRGIPSNIYSDCGTNFQGANRQLREILTTTASRQTTSLPCKWHFNPPAASHFGGIWEAAVKSAKYHLKRVIGAQTFTFEEMSTLSTQIEAILNSRPLTVLSSDPNDLRPLTPGDFSIGQPLVALPSPDLTSTPINRLTRWELIRQCTQSFWNRWSSEYLSSLQRRTKWTRQQPNVEVGDIVLINMPNKAPTYWPMGRVEEVHPGTDGIVRVATIQTADGIVKLAVLPVSDDPSC